MSASSANQFTQQTHGKFCTRSPVSIWLASLSQLRYQQQLTLRPSQLVTQGFWLFNLGKLRRHPRPAAFLPQTVDISLGEVIIRVLDEQLRAGHNVLKSFHLDDLSLRLGTRTDKSTFGSHEWLLKLAGPSMIRSPLFPPETEKYCSGLSSPSTFSRNPINPKRVEVYKFENT